MNEGVNAAICEAFEKGLIDRTTLMVNMPFAAEAMELAQKNGFAEKVGLHLNLTSGLPLTECMKSDTVMCNTGGEFTAEFARSMKTRFFLPRRTRKNLESEIRAQLDMYRQLGGTLWHVDSHHHVHTDPSIWSVARKVFRDYPVVSVRLSRNMYRGGNPLIRLYKSLFNSSIRRICIVKPKYFGSAKEYRDFTEGVPNLSDKCNVEVMVHPVYDNKGALSDISKGEFCALESLKP